MIQLDDDWRIRPDSRQWTLEKAAHRKDKDGNAIWRPCGYYRMLGDAMRSYVNQSVKSCRSVDGLMKKIDALQSHLDEVYPIEVPEDIDFLD